LAVPNLVEKDSLLSRQSGKEICGTTVMAESGYKCVLFQH
jgi:hypothetical protein